MEALFIPQPDTIPVSWGWLQFLLLLTFPLHLLAMNAMVGGVAIAVVQQLKGGSLRQELAHKIAIALPMVIAFVVNLGVAPLLFLQVLYGHFVYTSSIMMGIWWILVIPILIVAYYGAYLYDFKFKSLGSFGLFIGLLVLCIVLFIGFLFSNNMALMALPEQFNLYFSHRDGSYLVPEGASLIPRYLHMMFGALAVGGLFVSLLTRVWGRSNSDLVSHGDAVGLSTFLYATVANVCIGLWFFLSLEQEQMQVFLGDDLAATIMFFLGLLLAAGAVYGAFRKRFTTTFLHAVALVVVMSFLRSWLRASFLSEVFNLGQLQLVPQYSPMVFFFATLVLGIIAIAWLLRKAVVAMRTPEAREAK